MVCTVSHVVLESWPWIISTYLCTFHDVTIHVIPTHTSCNTLCILHSYLQIWGVWSHPPPSPCSAPHSSPPSLQQTSSPCNHRESTFANRKHCIKVLPQTHSEQLLNPSSKTKTVQWKHAGKVFSYWMSQASHTVEKCPQPSFRITWYFPL